MGVKKAQVFECDYYSCAQEAVILGVQEDDVPPGWVLIDVLRACGTLGQAIEVRGVIFCGHNHAREWFADEVRPSDSDDSGELR